MQLIFCLTTGKTKRVFPKFESNEIIPSENSLNFKDTEPQTTCFFNMC